MRSTIATVTAAFLLGAPTARAQDPPRSSDPVLEAIWRAGIEQSRVAELAQVLLDSLGPPTYGVARVRGGRELGDRHVPLLGDRGPGRTVRHLEGVAAGNLTPGFGGTPGTYARSHHAGLEPGNPGTGPGIGRGASSPR